MIVLSAQKVLQLHRFLMQETGGLDGLRDEGLFDSAVQGPFATFGGQELYPASKRKRQSWESPSPRTMPSWMETSVSAPLRCLFSWT